MPSGDHSGIAEDFADPTSVGSLVAGLGDVDVLVNNVGRFGLGGFESTTDEDWDHDLQVNLMSGVRLSRHVLPGMLERGWGRVLFVSSESGVNVPADMIPYGVAKAASTALRNGLAKRTRGTAVTVNSVLGGPTCSDGVASAVEAVAATQSAPVAARTVHRAGRDRVAGGLPGEPSRVGDEPSTSWSTPWSDGSAWWRGCCRRSSAADVRVV